MKSDVTVFISFVRIKNRFRNDRIHFVVSKTNDPNEDRLIGLEIKLKSIFGFQKWYQSDSKFSVRVMIYRLTAINLILTC